MVSRVRTRLSRGRSMLGQVGAASAAIAALGMLAALAGCGSGLRDGTGEEAQADVEPATPGSCASTVLEALGHVWRCASTARVSRASARRARCT